MRYNGIGEKQPLSQFSFHAGCCQPHPHPTLLMQPDVHTHLVLYDEPPREGNHDLR